MSVIQGIAAAAAVVVAAGPQLRQAAGWVASAVRGKPAATTTSPSYQDSVASLAAVRLRLKATERLEDAQKAAINVLTLALVDGSDQ